MPNPSYWPIIVAFGASLMAGLVIVNPYLAFIGGAITMMGVYGWIFEPAGPEEHH
jgi:cytochrome c oxidase subunit 1